MCRLSNPLQVILEFTSQLQYRGLLFLFLFRNKPVEGAPVNAKVALDDAIVGVGPCVGSFGVMMWGTLFIALLFWLIRLIFVIYNTILNWEIRAFYRTALGISDVSSVDSKVAFPLILT